MRLDAPDILERVRHKASSGEWIEMTLGSLLDNHRNLAMILSGLFAGVIFYQSSEHGIFLENGWIRPHFVLGCFSAMFFTGLVVRQDWSRWVGQITLLGAIGAGLNRMCTGDVSAMGVFMIGWEGYSVWVLRTMPITLQQEHAAIWRNPAVIEHLEKIGREVSEQNSAKVSIVFRSAVTMDVARLAELAAQAFGVTFGEIEEAIEPLDAAFLPMERTGPVVGGSPPVFICSCPPHLLGVYVISDDSSDSEFSEDGLTSEHRALVEIERLPQIGESASSEDPYLPVCRLAAELLDENVVGIRIDEGTRFIEMPSDLAAIFRGPDPTSVFMREDTA